MRFDLENIPNNNFELLEIKKYVNTLNKFKQNIGKFTYGVPNINKILNGTESVLPRFEDQYDNLMEQCNLIKDPITLEQSENFLLYVSLFPTKEKTALFLKKIKFLRNIIDSKFWIGFCFVYRNFVL